MPRRSHGDDLSSITPLLTALSLPAPACIDASAPFFHRSNAASLLALISTHAALLSPHISVIIFLYRLHRETCPLDAVLTPLLMNFKFTPLTHLDLSCTPLCLTPTLTATLATLPCLVNLNLNDTGIIPSRLAAVATSTPRLERLSIAHNRFLAPTSTLTTSTVSPGAAVQVEDALTTALLSIASSCPRLEALDLRIAGVNLNHLRALAACTSTLRCMYISSPLAALLQAHAATVQVIAVDALPHATVSELQLQLQALRVHAASTSTRGELVDLITSTLERRRFDSNLARIAVTTDDRWAASCSSSSSAVTLPRLEELSAAVATRTAAARALGVRSTSTESASEVNLNQPASPPYVSLLSNLNSTPPRRLEPPTSPLPPLHVDVHATGSASPGKRSRNAFETVMKPPPECSGSSSGRGGALLALRRVACRPTLAAAASGHGALGSVGGALYTRRCMRGLTGEEEGEAPPVCALQTLLTL